VTSIESDFVRAIDALAGGGLRTVDLDGFADLSRDHARMLGARWSALPDAVRSELVHHAFQRSIEDVAQNFDEVVVVATGDAIPEIRRVAVAALWETQSRAAASRLLDLLESDEDDTVRAACCAALGRWVLQREFEAGDPEFGDRIVDALVARAGGGDGSPELRAAALVAVATRSIPAVATLLRDAYYEGDRALRLASLVGMGLSAQTQWLEYIYEQLQSDDPEFRRAAATACGEIADEDSVDALADALEDEDVAVVAAALDALTEIGGDLASDYLAKFRRRVPEELADDLAAALAAMRQEDADPDADEEDDW
jgi:HEAT repeat protein